MHELSKERLERYLSALFHAPATVTALVSLRESKAFGAAKEYGYGHPVKVEFTVGGERRAAVLETTSPGPFGHEHMADRARMMLWDHGAYNALPKHVRSLDVGAFDREGNLLSVGERRGVLPPGRTRRRNRVHPGHRPFAGWGSRCATWTSRGRTPCAITSSRSTPSGGRTRDSTSAGSANCWGTASASWGCATAIPSPTGSSPPRCWRRSNGVASTWRWRLKERTDRLRQVHGDYHPFNILFREGTDFTVLDRSRGEWGEPADDVTALTGNYLFASLQATGRLEGPFETLFRRFWDRYIERTGDAEILETAAPFFAFRCLVMASPVWYPSLDESVRRKLFSFVLSILDAPSFAPDRVNGWLDAI